MSNRRVFRNANNDHLQSPYARSNGPRSPHPSKITQLPKTPGSIFSKVKQMFSPSAWLSENEQASRFDDESDISIVSTHQNPPEVNFNREGSRTPSNPFQEFRRLQTNNELTTESPNIKLARFFAEKGSEPITEIELEGVKALLAQSQSKPSSPNNTLNDTINDSFDSSMDRSKILKPQASGNALSSTPSFKPTYNTSVSDADISTASIVSNPNSAVHKKRVFDYSGFPSPYRTSRLKSSFSINDLRDRKRSQLQAGEILKEKVKPTEDEPPIENKKLSNTASALLSFLENNDEKKQEPQAQEKQKIVDFSNPYASTKKNRKSISRPVKKPSAVEQLQQTLASEPDAGKEKEEEKEEEQEAKVNHQQQQPALLNKYRPTKSSSLRESISLDDDSNDDSKIEADVETIEVEPKEEPPKVSTSASTQDKPSSPSFSFSASTSASFKPSGFSFAQSASQPAMVPKPSFTALEEPVEKNFSPPQKSLFSFAQPFSETKSKSDVNNTSLSIIEPEQEVITTQPSFPSASANFVFPNAEGSGFTLKNIDETKVRQFKSLFSF